MHTLKLYTATKFHLYQCIKRRRVALTRHFGFWFWWYL